MVRPLRSSSDQLRLTYDPIAPPLCAPSALRWDPDRFLDERVQKYLTPNPFIFLPFNAGPRICLGQQVRPIPVSLSHSPPYPTTPSLSLSLRPHRFTVTAYTY